MSKSATSAGLLVIVLITTGWARVGTNKNSISLRSVDLSIRPRTCWLLEYKMLRVQADHAFTDMLVPDMHVLIFVCH